METKPLFDWNVATSWSAMISELVPLKRITAKSVRESLTRNYAGVSAFHACRPISVESYYREGLKVSNSHELDSQALRLFYGPAPTPAEIRRFDRAAKELGKRDEGTLFLSLDKRSLIQRSGHYLVYGSERLLCLAAYQGYDVERFRDILRNTGVPTLFRVRLWWSDLDDKDFDSLTRHVLQNVRYVNGCDEPPFLLFSVKLRRAIAATDILDHSFPTEITDPMKGNTVYKVPRAER